jgi:hypothetical protein
MKKKMENGDWQRNSSILPRQYIATIGPEGRGPGGVRLAVDSTAFLLSVYNQQQKFEQNLHLQINPKIYNLRFRQNALKYLKNQRSTFKHDSIEL